MKKIALFGKPKPLLNYLSPLTGFKGFADFIFEFPESYNEDDKFVGAIIEYPNEDFSSVIELSSLLITDNWLLNAVDRSYSGTWSTYLLKYSGYVVGNGFGMSLKFKVWNYIKMQSEKRAGYLTLVEKWFIESSQPYYLILADV